MKLTKNYMLHNVLGEYTLIPTYGSKVEMNKILNLNDTAVFVYMGIKDNKPLDKIKEEMSKEYDASLDIISKDVDELIEYFIKKGIVEE